MSPLTLVVGRLLLVVMAYYLLRPGAGRMTGDAGVLSVSPHGWTYVEADEPPVPAAVELSYDDLRDHIALHRTLGWPVTPALLEAVR